MYGIMDRENPARRPDRMIFNHGRKAGLFMKHSVLWWVFIGWWWYICIAWWFYPIKWILSKKSSSKDNKDIYQLKCETMESIIDFMKSSGGTALQTDVKKGISKKLEPYFDDAVHELYQNGKIKTLKVGSRIRLELV